MGLWGLGETVYSSKFVREEQGRAPGSHPDTAAAYINTNIAEW